MLWRKADMVLGRNADPHIGHPAIDTEAARKLTHML